MAPHSSTLAWKIPWTEEPGGPQSMRSLKVRHDWATSLSLFTFLHWRRKWQPAPVFLPGESQGRRSLVGGRLWGPTESDTTERLHFHFTLLSNTLKASHTHFLLQTWNHAHPRGENSTYFKISGCMWEMLITKNWITVPRLCQSAELEGSFLSPYS